MRPHTRACVLGGKRVQGACPYLTTCQLERSLVQAMPSTLWYTWDMGPDVACFWKLRNVGALRPVSRFRAETTLASDVLIQNCSFKSYLIEDFFFFKVYFLGHKYHKAEICNWIGPHMLARGFLELTAYSFRLHWVVSFESMQASRVCRRSAQLEDICLMTNFGAICSWVCGLLCLCFCPVPMISGVLITTTVQVLGAGLHWTIALYHL